MHIKRDKTFSRIKIWSTLTKEKDFEKTFVDFPHLLWYVCATREVNKMKLLEEFWYGNINPMERPFQSQRKFNKVFRLLTKNEEELLKNLNEQEKELFDKVKACYDEMIQITECQTFIKGFKLGARFFIECFENDADIFDE